MNDEEFMKIAIEISVKAKYPYGAIIVNNHGEIIGRSDSDEVKNDTPFCHAELIAIQDAIKNNNLYGELKGCTMYVSCEPCPMCMGAILYEEFDRLVYGAKLEDSHKYYCPEVLLGCEEVANATKNRKITIVNILRNEAVEVLKNKK